MIAFNVETLNAITAPQLFGNGYTVKHSRKVIVHAVPIGKVGDILFIHVDLDSPWRDSHIRIVIARMTLIGLEFINPIVWPSLKQSLLNLFGGLSLHLLNGIS